MTGFSAQATARICSSQPAPGAPGSEAGESHDILVHAYARDASHFLLVPSQVHRATSEDDVVQLFANATKRKQPITFRSGGSSLSGQSVTRQTLIDSRRHFTGVEVLDGGRRIRVEPGVTIRYANTLLRPYGYRLGPDPASEIACTLGGALANNSSGMTCGTEFNAYRTLESMVLVLPSGTVIDTAAADANLHLKVTEPEIHNGLSNLRDRVRSNPQSVSEIQRLFSMKNTMGYSVNAFVDFEEPIDILAHLMIGSEGTLGFIASAVLRTLPVSPFASTSLAVYPSLEAASEGLPELALTACRAIELMDSRAIKVARRGPFASDLLPSGGQAGETVLLFEVAGGSAEELQQNVADLKSVIAKSRATKFATAPDTESENKIWRARKGLYALVAGARPRGTSALLEDIAVPMDLLAQTCTRLSRMLDTFDYCDSVIFGHARDGNLHFLLNEDFSTDAGLKRYARFTDELVDLVLVNKGTLKAEHGTGRVMAPYLERQYGPELHSVMVEIKRLIDPHGILNPDVIISNDATIHLKDLKATPQVEEVVDRCVDCGFCEPVCPSRNITTTPRQRIAIQRAKKQARDSGDIKLLTALVEATPESVVDSCAVDGMCATVCPLGINTGTLVEQLRQENNSATENRLAGLVADHWGLATSVVAAGVTLAHTFPKVARSMTTQIRRWTSSHKVPLIAGSLPRGGKRRRPLKAETPDIIYLPSCMNRLFASAAGSTGVSPAFLGMCQEAGISVRIPDNIDQLCCGTPWKSKGLSDGYRRMQVRLTNALLSETRAGKIPVVTDASSCTEGFMKALNAGKHAGEVNITVIDAVSFTVNELLPRLPEVETKFESMTLHPTCSVIRLGLEDELHKLAAHVATRTFIPSAWGCCAFAGDRGLLVPGLTQSATHDQAKEIEETKSEVYASCNRTCEIGMTRATGENYSHILELFAAALRMGTDNYVEGVHQ